MRQSTVKQVKAAAAWPTKKELGKIVEKRPDTMPQTIEIPTSEWKNAAKSAADAMASMLIDYVAFGIETAPGAMIGLATMYGVPFSDVAAWFSNPDFLGRFVREMNARRVQILRPIAERMGVPLMADASRLAAEIARRLDAVPRSKRITKRGTVGYHTFRQWIERVEFYGWRCRYCRCELTHRNLVKEHRIPIARGGSDWASNLVPSCTPCNSQKSTKTEVEYLEQEQQKRIGAQPVHVVAINAARRAFAKDAD